MKQLDPYNPIQCTIVLAVSVLVSAPSNAVTLNATGGSVTNTFTQGDFADMQVWGQYPNLHGTVFLFANGVTADDTQSGDTNAPMLLDVIGSSPDSAQPDPIAAWLYGSGLIGLAEIARRKRNKPYAEAR